MTQSTGSAGDTVLRFITIPWGVFIAAFVFYVGVTLAAISVEQLSDALMTAAYVAPAAIYALALLARALVAVAALIPPVHTPAPLPR